MVASGPTGVTVEFELAGLETVDVEIREFGKGTKFAVPGQGSVEGEVGAPNVPVVRQGVQIPNTGKVTVQVLSEQTRPLGTYSVVPTQPPASVCLGPAPFEMNREIYARSEFYPPAFARIRSIEILRDIRLARLWFYPVRVNPVTGEVVMVTSARVRLAFSDEPGENELKRVYKGITRDYIGFYKDILNFDKSLLSQDSGEVPSYIFLGNDETLAAVDELIKWKKRKGFEVHEVTTDEAGTSADAIDSWIEEAYNTWENPPLYVFLIGDETVIPPMMSQNSADHYFGVVGSGSDSSIGIGRINQQNGDMGVLTYQAHKILKYEMEPYVEGGFFNRAGTWGCTGLGGNETADRWARILEGGGLQVDTWYEGGGASGAALAEEFNKGMTMFGMKGHGSQTSWSSASFSVSTIQNSLDNGWKLPFISSIGCNNCQFNVGGYYSFCEAWMCEGSVDSPKGAVGILGWTVSSGMSAEQVIEGIWKAMFELDPAVWHVALGMNYGKTLISNTSDIVHAMIFGDPELAPYTVADPPQLEVEHTAPRTGRSFEAVVTAGGSPVEGALVGVVQKSDYARLGAGYTDASGTATFDLESGTGELYITATHYDTLPYLGEGTDDDDDDDDDDNNNNDDNNDDNDDNDDTSDDDDDNDDASDDDDDDDDDNDNTADDDDDDDTGIDNETGGCGCALAGKKSALPSLISLLSHL